MSKENKAEWTFEKYACITMCVCGIAFATVGAVEAYAKAKYAPECDCSAEPATEPTP